MAVMVRFTTESKSKEIAQNAAYEWINPGSTEFILILWAVTLCICITVCIPTWWHYG